MRRTDRSRVLIAVANMPVPEDQRVWAQAKACVGAGWSVTVICPALRGHTAERVLVDGVSVRYFGCREGNGLLGTLREVASATAKLWFWGIYELLVHRSTVVQVCNPPDSMFPLLLIARMLGRRTIYDQHDAVPELAASRPAYRRLAGAMAMLERTTVKAAHATLVASEGQRARLMDLYAEPAVLVRSASAELTSISAPVAKNAPRIRRLLYLGVIGEQDGVERLVEAVAIVIRRQSVAPGSFVVAIAGDGPNASSVRQLAEREGVGDAIIFHGWLTGQALAEAIARADGLVVPDPLSPFNHLCAMNKVTTATASGKPLVMTPLRENLLLAESAAFVAKSGGPEELADAIEQFCSAPAEVLNAMGLEAKRLHAENSSWTLNGQVYLDSLRC